MPRRDGTGPMGTGSMTGRGLGLCGGVRAGKSDAGVERGAGFACRRGGGGLGFDLGRGRSRGSGSGFGQGSARNMAVNQIPFGTSKELLMEQKEILQSQLDAINKQLGDV